MTILKTKFAITIISEFDIDETMPEEARKELDKIMAETVANTELNLKEAFIDRLSNNSHLHSLINKINKWDIKVKIGGKK